MEVSYRLQDPAVLPRRKRDPGTNWIGDCVGPRPGLDAVVKSIANGKGADSSNHLLITNCTYLVRKRNIKTVRNVVKCKTVFF
jgi:hypothetical protein